MDDNFPFKRITKSTISVLRHLLTSHEETWGLEISKATGYSVGTVYPILEKLEKAAWIQSQWEVQNERSGPRRRIYKLNPDKIQSARSIVMKFESDKSNIRASNLQTRLLNP